jgi:EAL domain-containing protein (putative c-di-GMP-specific phosphodiesterase class I)
MELLYQPIVTLRRCLGAPYEVSVRIPQPDGEYVALDRSLAAEDRRLWVDADRRVLERALDSLRRWHPGQPGLRFFVPQTATGTADEGWTDWLREQILARELVRHRPVIQYDFADVAAEGARIARRLEALRRLGIRVCLNGVDDSERVFEVIGSCPGTLVRLAKGAAALDVKALTALVQGLHEHEVEVISADAENPQAIARVWSAGVDFIQGGLLQLPAAEPSFDFSEIRIG